MGRRRQPVHLEDEAEESGELNLVPYLDIITTLVIFLVFTFQVIIEFRLIELMPPAFGASANNADDNPDEPKRTLTLMITTDGYKLVTDDPTLGQIAIPKKGKDYDNALLTAKLAETKLNLGLDESMQLVASNEIEYQIVVAAMDAARADKKGKLLFPDVLLASVGGVP